MRKQLKLLLLVVTIMALFAMAMIVGSAAEHTASSATELTAALEKAAAGDTIKLTANITTSATITVKTSVTIDGTNEGGEDFSITSTAQMFTFGAKDLNFTVKNVTLNANKSSTYPVTRNLATSAGLTFKLDGSTLNVANAVDSIQAPGAMTMHIHNSNVNVLKTLLRGNSGGISTLKITGASNIVCENGASNTKLTRTDYVNIIVGSESGVSEGTPDDIHLTLGGYLSENTAAVSVVIYNGTFTHTYKGQASYGMIAANAGSVKIHGGTFNLEANGGFLFGTTAAGTVSTATFDIYGGTFNLKNGAGFAAASNVPAGLITVAPAEGKTIAVTIDEASAALDGIEEYFKDAKWASATITYIKPEGDPVFAVYKDGAEVSKHVTFLQAYEQIQAGNGDTIKLLADVTLVAPLTLDADVIVDGAGKTITLDESVASGWFFTMSAAKVTIKNVTLVDSLMSGGLFQFTAGGTYTLDGVTASNAAEWFEFTAGGATLLVSNSTFETATTGTTVSSNAKAAAPALMQFTNCTLKAEKLADDTASAMFTNLGATYVFDSCTALMTSDATVANMFIYGNSLAIDVTIKGNTTITTATVVYLRYGGSLTIGSEDGEDNIVINSVARVVRTQRANVEINIYSGTFNLGANGFTYLENSTGTATAQMINIYGGTFKLAKAWGMFGSKAAGTDLGASKLTITKGIFELSNGATFLGTDLTMENVALGDDFTENPGDITFKLGAGTAEKVETAQFFATDFWVLEAWAHFYITGWNAAEAATAVEISADWAGTYAEYLAQFCKVTTPDDIYGSYLDGDDLPYFLTPEQDEELANFFVADGLVLAPAFAPFTVTSGATVTLTDWALTYAGTLATVTNGKLILNNCQITVTEVVAAQIPLILVKGENTALEVNGGVYDAAGLSYAVLFLIGGIPGNEEYETAPECPNCYAEFNGVTIWASESNSNNPVISAENIGRLTVKNTLISPYKGVVMGNAANTLPEGAAAVSTNGISTNATKTYIENVEIHGAGSAGSLFVYGGTLYAKDFVSNSYTGITLTGTADVVVNLYSGTISNGFFNSNYVGIDLQNANGVANIYGGTFRHFTTIGTNSMYNDQGFLGFRKNGGTINIYGGSFISDSDMNTDTSKRTDYIIGSDDAAKINNKVNIFAAGTAYVAYDGTTAYSTGVTLTKTGAGGAIFELGEGCEVTVYGATIELLGTDMVVVTGAITNITFVDCRFNVTAAQEGILFAAGEFKGKTLVVAPADTKVTADFTLGAYAQSVKYAGVALKLWVSLDGVANGAEDGASVYVDTANEETSGLKFDTVLTKAVIDALLAQYEGATIKAYYTLIAPMDYVAKVGGVFTKEALDGLNVTGDKYVAIEAKNSLLTDEVTGDVSYSGTLVSLNSNTRLYAAVSMIELEIDGKTEFIYGEFDSAANARSAEQIANAMIADLEGEYYTAYSDAQKAIVDKYAGKSEQ